MGDRDVVTQRSHESPPLARQFREQVARERQTSTSTSFLRRIFKIKLVLDPPSDQTLINGGSNLITDQSIDASTSSNNNNRSVTVGCNNREDPSRVDSSKVHGFSSQALLLQQYLLASDNNGFKSAAIFGVAGVGKTTLCQLVFNQAELKGKCFPRIWVTLSNETPNDTAAVVRSLLEELGVDQEIVSSIPNDRGLAGLLYALYLQLDMKPYLIVLDGVREADKCCQELRSCANRNAKKWGEEFSYGFPKSCEGAVLITTRSKEAAKRMVGPEGFLYQLHPLSDPNSCWLIYQGSVLTARGEEAPETPSEEVKEELRKKSGGLPRALVMLGEIKRATSVDQNSILVAATDMINHVDVS